MGTTKADHSIWVEKQSYGNIEYVRKVILSRQKGPGCSSRDHPNPLPRAMERHRVTDFSLRNPNIRFNVRAERIR